MVDYIGVGAVDDALSAERVERELDVVVHGEAIDPKLYDVRRPGFQLQVCQAGKKAGRHSAS